MKTVFQFALLCLMVSLWSCQDGATSASDTPTLFAEYYIRYLEEEGQLRAQVSYLQGDSLTNAKPTTLHSVFFQGGAMEVRKIGNNGLRYRSERVTKYSNPFNFTYNQAAGISEQYDIDMSPLTGFSLEGALSRSGTTRLEWEGEPLTEKESIVLIFTDHKNQTAVIDVKGPTQGKKVTIDGAQLEKLSPGELKLYLVKKKKDEEKRKDAISVSTIEFYTKSSALQLQD